MPFLGLMSPNSPYNNHLCDQESHVESRHLNVILGVSRDHIDLSVAI